MARSFLRKLVSVLVMTGCIISCFSVSVSGSPMTFVADYFLAYKVPEGENITIDCSTVEPAYYSALSFHHSSVPPFYLAPDGKKFIQQGQVFTITNVTEQDNGNYSCLVKDKNLQSTVLQVAEINIIPPKPEVLDLDNAPSSPLFQTNPVELKAAAKKLSESKPYLFFKEKSPLRISHKQTKPFELTFSVKGLQPIKMRWTKDDRELLIGTRYKTFDSGRRLVVDPPFTPEDSGTYSVSACNSIGCTVRGVQVLIYVTPNNTKLLQAGEDIQDEGFIGNFAKKYGFLGIPVGLAVILIIALACSARGTGKKEEKNKEEFIEEIHIQGTEGRGRTASLWSWQSDAESSPDEMPDYDGLKSSKKRAHRRHDSPDPETGDAEDQHGEGIYDLLDYREQRHYSNIDARGETDHYHQDSSSKDEINYSTIKDFGDQYESYGHEHSNEQGNYDMTQQRELQESTSDEQIVHTAVDNRTHPGPQRKSRYDVSSDQIIHTAVDSRTHPGPQRKSRYDVSSDQIIHTAVDSRTHPGPQRKSRYDVSSDQIIHTAVDNRTHPGPQRKKSSYDASNDQIIHTASNMRDYSGPQGKSSYDRDNDQIIHAATETKEYSGPQRKSSQEESLNTSSDRSISGYNPPRLNEGYDETEEDSNGVVYSSFDGLVQSGVQTMRAQVMENTDPAKTIQTAQDHPHTFNIEDLCVLS